MSWQAMRYQKHLRNRVERKARPANRRGKPQRHHLINKCRGGTRDVWNLLQLWGERHKAWHELFLNMDLDEIITALQRVRRLKMRQRWAA